MNLEELKHDRCLPVSSRPLTRDTVTTCDPGDLPRMNLRGLCKWRHHLEHLPPLLVIAKLDVEKDGRRGNTFVSRGVCILQTQLSFLPSIVSVWHLPKQVLKHPGICLLPGGTGSMHNVPSR